MTAPQTYVIAEAGVNHNGVLSQALELIDAAAAAGADAVKFQTFVPEALVSKTAGKAEYQKHTTGSGESQLDMLRRLALAPEDFAALQKHCNERGIQFLSSPFDITSASTLFALGLQRIKLGSGELTNAPLLLHIARSDRDLILSTGMSTLAEIEQALGVVAYGYLDIKERPSLKAFTEAYHHPSAKTVLRNRVALLHCTTEYPAPLADVNLRAMLTLRERFGLSTGYSDHTVGYSAPLAAVALGAEIIEKHFTLDRTLPGPDHKASLEPEELRAMIQAIREVELALGSGKKEPAESERKNAPIARKSVVANGPICKGEQFTENNLTTKRIGHGVSAIHYFDMLGRTADIDYDDDEAIAP